ncbi:antibiotic biosynthesis monooxygenase [Ferrimonas sediminicola]|uniref:Antibiotic biosynthesis monooxygenase n=1 Tax=Ferrimonas sediminicola TaxID=2569538 RepID=A0A4U1BH70_9GAMM|nr:antibiotic biosynthesis monooxygenase [Ferrimonas sediminicola]TKB50377.1 antibiotic biosynthesis monooxygenase [Ferrimonas sediminicola]
MYAVIFKAKAGVQDSQYSQMVELMRELAFSQYQCQDFIAVTEGDQEIAISYWDSEEDIRRWHADSQHALAQRFGRKKWYRSYVVEVVKIERRYAFGG